MKNQQNGRVILWLTWQKYETMYQLLTCTFRRFQKHSNDNGYGDRFTGTIARDNYIMNQIDSTENQNQNGLKPASDLQENGTILKIVEETDFGPPSYENGGEKVIHFNENAEVVSNGSHSDDSDSGEEDATSL